MHNQNDFGSHALALDLSIDGHLCNSWNPCAWHAPARTLIWQTPVPPPLRPLSLPDQGRRNQAAAYL